MSIRAYLAATAMAIVLTPSLAYGQTAGATGPRATPMKTLDLTQDAWNARLRDRGQSRTRPGYVRYIYNPEDVFPIRTRESMITTIKLPEGVKVIQAFAGDDAGFQVAIPEMPVPNTIAIKALYPGVDTNLVAYDADGRVYTFYVRSEGYNSKSISDFLVNVVMPGKGVVEAGLENSNVAELRANERAEEKSPDLKAQRIRDPYAASVADASGKSDFADNGVFDPRTVVEDLAVFIPEGEMAATLPYRVFRDDRFTYVDYGNQASQMTEWPTPAIVIQGVESPVGFRTQGENGRLLVLEALGEFTLRNGQRVLCIKQKGSVYGTKNSLVPYQQANSKRMKIPKDLPAGRRAPVIRSDAAPVRLASDGQPMAGSRQVVPVQAPVYSKPPQNVVVTETVRTVSVQPKMQTPAIVQPKIAPVGRMTEQKTETTVTVVTTPVSQPAVSATKPNLTRETPVMVIQEPSPVKVVNAAPKVDEVDPRLVASASSARGAVRGTMTMTPPEMIDSRIVKPTGAEKLTRPCSIIADNGVPCIAVSGN